MRELLITNQHFRDLNPILYGNEDCAPGHCYGPAIRSYHLLHYVERGRGVYEVDGVCYPVGAGEAFLILPGKMTVYTADENDPWSYRWIGFNGELASAFDRLPPVFPVEADVFPLCGEGENNPEYRLAARLFELYATLFPEQPKKGGASRGNRYVDRVRDYVRLTYMLPSLRVEEVARKMNLDRRYLSRLFREETGQSLQAFLISVRMREADRYLRMGISVGETARLCGYTDVFNFSKMFKKTYGISPSSIIKKAGR